MARSCRLFSSGPWLPLRDFDFASDDAESIEFSTKDELTLRGSFYQHAGERRRGTIVYYHEMNGNRRSIGPHVKKIREAGFGLLTFDQRGHGQSDAFEKFHPTPWVSKYDLADIRAAVDYVVARPDYEGTGIGVFGLGKGATLALCSASLDPRVGAVVMDCPAPEERLYEKNCWIALTKSGTALATRRFALFSGLLLKAMIYLIACPFISLFSAWRRFILSLWYGGSFVNTWHIVRRLRKPILILHGELNSGVDLEQVHSFCQRMPVRPKLWLGKPLTESGLTIEETTDPLGQKVVSFFSKTIDSSEPPNQPQPVASSRPSFSTSYRSIPEHESAPIENSRLKFAKN